jgi:hypothetical protein
VGGTIPHFERLSEAETLTLAVRYETAYRTDPLMTYHELIGLYGRDNTASIVRWIEAAQFSCTIDESAGLGDNFDPKEAA